MTSKESNLQRRIYTVTQLNARIKMTLEEHFSLIWVSGEVSNLRIPASKHSYFTLKDPNAQIGAVMFRGQKINLKFELEDGMSIIGLGRIGVYEPRGTYQVIFEYMEPSGVGALQVAFERLKARLAKEGLFDEAHKKPLSFLPSKISLITSPSGAAVHDFLQISNRRFPNIPIRIYPVKVQGHNSDLEIVAAIEKLNSLGDCDVIVLARGGGSLEDLSAFNSEYVARAIFSSMIPVVSAVGHETDFTIADFVADLRAPTPSAAAELVLPLKDNLTQRCAQSLNTLHKGIKSHIQALTFSLAELSKRLVNPRKKIQDLALRIDDHTARLYRHIRFRLQNRRDQLTWRQQRLNGGSLQNRIRQLKVQLYNTYHKLSISNKNNILLKYSKLRENTARLDALNPAAILARGYSITRTRTDSTIIRDAQSVALGQELEIILHRGSLACRVEGKQTDGQTDL